MPKMKFFYSLLIIALLGLPLSTKELSTAETLPLGDVNSGSNLVAQCAACHGASGASINSDWPNLAGQGQQYLFLSLNIFKAAKEKIY